MRMCMCGHPDIAHEHLGGRCEAGGTATRERILRCDCERFKEQKQAPPPTPPPPAPAAGLLGKWIENIEHALQCSGDECGEDDLNWTVRSLEDFARRLRETWDMVPDESEPRQRCLLRELLGCVIGQEKRP